MKMIRKSEIPERFLEQFFPCKPEISGTLENFYGLRNKNRKNFWVTKWKLEILQFPFRKPEKFPD